MIPRDRLAGVLREVALGSYGEAITLHYDVELTSVRWVAGAEGGGEVPVVTMGSSVAGAAVAGAGATEIRCGLLVGADGTARTLATAMESRGKLVS